MIMRWSNVQTNECDLQAEKYLIICTHHKLRTNDENKTQFSRNVYGRDLPNFVGIEWAECLLIIGRVVEFKFLAWSSIAQSVCQQAFSLLVNSYLRPWVRILPSAEEDNLSPFDSNIACLCQSIEINNNKHVYTRAYVHQQHVSFTCPG